MFTGYELVVCDYIIRRHKIRKKEFKIKESRVRNLLELKDISGLLLTTHNFLWYTCGGRNNIIKNDGISIVNILIALNKNYLLATTSDAERVMKEELPGFDFELVLYNWHDENYFNALKRIKGIDNIAGDFENPDIMNLESEISDIRMSLTEFEISRLKETCKRYSELLTDYCSGLENGISEEKISNGLNIKCLDNNI